MQLNRADVAVSTQLLAAAANGRRPALSSDGRRRPGLLLLRIRRPARPALTRTPARATLLQAIANGTPQALRELLVDLDDRLRLLMWGGALYLGVEGLVPFVAVPLLELAMRSLTHTRIFRGSASGARRLPPRAALAALTLLCRVQLVFAALPCTSCSRRASPLRGCVVRLVGRVDRRHATAVVCAIDARRPPPTAEDEPLQAAEGLLATPRGEELLFSRGVVGYDHHCIWIDAQAPPTIAGSFCVDSSRFSLPRPSRCHHGAPAWPPPR